MTVENLTEVLGRWAEDEPDVRAVALVGSHARGHARPGSDVDLVVLVDDVARRLGPREWLGSFGEVTTADHEAWGLVQSLRVHYGDGLEVKFGLTSTDWATPPIDVGTAAVIRDGLAPVWDPEAWLAGAVHAVSAGGE